MFTMFAPRAIHTTGVVLFPPRPIHSAPRFYFGGLWFWWIFFWLVPVLWLVTRAALLFVTVLVIAALQLVTWAVQAPYVAWRKLRGRSNTPIETWAQARWQGRHAQR